MFRTLCVQDKFDTTSTFLISHKKNIVCVCIAIAPFVLWFRIFLVSNLRRSYVLKIVL